MSMDKARFFDSVRDGILGPTLDSGEVEGCETILDVMADLPISWRAYALATAYHETAHTMMPVKEHGGDRYFFRMYDINGNRPHVARALGNIYPGDGVRFAGRGYPQLTGRRNYERASKVLGIDCVAHPEELMVPANAAKVMRSGMIEGWFTGKGFEDYLRQPIEVRSNFWRARRIINGTDRADWVAGCAISFQKAICSAEIESAA